MRVIFLLYLFIPWRGACEGPPCLRSLRVRITDVPVFLLPSYSRGIRPDKIDVSGTAISHLYFIRARAIHSRALFKRRRAICFSRRPPTNAAAAAASPTSSRDERDTTRRYNKTPMEYRATPMRLRMSQIYLNFYAL